MKTISIVDYGMGNLNSVEKAFELAIFNQNLQNKLNIKITNDRDEIKNSDAIVLPGVGAFGAAMQNLKNFEMVDTLREIAIVEKKPFLGICLGYQLLFEKSYEEGEYNGLGIIKGEVRKFDEKAGLKIPHMGWNTVDFGKNVSFLLKQEFNSSTCSDLYFYFVHSYFVEIGEGFSGDVFLTEYGKKFAAGIQFENIVGLQFHPEKSQENGIKLLKSWCNKVYGK